MGSLDNEQRTKSVFLLKQIIIFHSPLKEKTSLEGQFSQMLEVSRVCFCLGNGMKPS